MYIVVLMTDVNEMGLMSLLIPNGKIRVHIGNVINLVRARVDILLIQN